MATYTPKRLAGPAQAPSSSATIYTAPSGGAVVKQILLNNTNTTAVTITANLRVSSGTSAAASNAFITSLSIAPNSQVIWSADIPLASGEIIALNASSATSITYIISGIEIS